MSCVRLSGAKIVVPDGTLDGVALTLRGPRIEHVCPAGEGGAVDDELHLGGGWLLPGFIDTQVNGGGDVLLNDDRTAEGVAAIARAHRRYGTTGLLPTLISDDAGVVGEAISAVEQAIADDVPGVLGIHLEGPHLNRGKKGIHDATKFTLLDEVSLEKLCASSRGVRLVTLAPELAPPGAIRELSQHGVVVAAGHSLADYDQTAEALREGMTGFTHLFNAMTQLGSRDPGMVGAALDDRASWFGIIADGAHVHPATLRVAVAARGLDGPMLVTDAMPPVGGAKSVFNLMGQQIGVVDGTCRGPDGTLAGSALTMAQAFRNAVGMLGLTIPQASRLASGNPAAFLGLGGLTGSIRPALRADLVHLDDDLRVTRTWIAGSLEEIGE